MYGSSQLAAITGHMQLPDTVKQVCGLQCVLLQAVCMQVTCVAHYVPICLVEQLQLLLLAIGNNR